MGHKYLNALFTDSIREFQSKNGSRAAYQRVEQGGRANDRLSGYEAAFIEARDSFYMASVTEDGWPYVQHRGGAAGFLKVLSPTQLAFADYAGNKQYITTGNLSKSQKVSLIMIDYPNRARLKLAGIARVVEDDAELLEVVTEADRDTPIERVILIDLVGFDWNCSKYITPRFTLDEIAALPNQSSDALVS